MKSFLLHVTNQLRAWELSAQHKQQWRELQADAVRAFTEHPSATGETYLQHLWFTLTMSARFIYTTVVLMIHGLFPFLLTRAASTQIEHVYRIMKTRIPKSQRDVIDSEYNL